jgi:hypothetical protein
VDTFIENDNMIRIILYGLIFLLVIRMINSTFRSKPTEKTKEDIKTDKAKKKRVSMDVGEYVDYEDIK